MPLSLRLPAQIESEIAAFSTRHKTSKSAVILRSIREFLTAHAQPSSQAIYGEEMQAAVRRAQAGVPPRVDARPHKIQYAQLMAGKHARRTGQPVKRMAARTGKAGA